MWVLLLVSYTMFAVNIAILIILFVMMQLWRWEHSGRVCSGDYLTQDPTEAEKNMYLIQEGKFIQWVLILVYIAFGVASLTICIVACCTSSKHEAISDEENRLRKHKTGLFSAPVDAARAEAERDRRRSKMINEFNFKK